MNEVQSDSRLEIFRRRLHGSANGIRWSARDIAQIASHFGLDSVDVPKAGNVHRAPPAAVPVMKGETGSDQTFTFEISNNRKDRMDDIIDVSGWIVEPFRSNPVVLWGHLSEVIPIGKATKVWVQGDRLMMSMKFVPSSISPEAEKVKKMVEAGFLCATSVGFLPLKFSFSKDPARPLGIDFHVQTLLEVSLVAVPANEFCLLQGKPSAEGKTHGTPRLDEARRWLAKHRGSVRS